MLEIFTYLLLFQVMGVVGEFCNCLAMSAMAVAVEKWKACC